MPPPEAPAPESEQPTPPPEEQPSLLGRVGKVGLLGLGLHTGSNVASKAFFNSDAGRKFLAHQMATGYRHGTEGKEINPWLRAAGTLGAGPELFEGYDLGHHAGGQGVSLADLHTGSKALQSLPATKQVPLLRDVPEALSHLKKKNMSWVDRLPAQTAGARTALQRYGIPAAGVLTGLALPHLGVHMGINAARSGLAHSAYGQDYMRNQLQRGLLERPLTHPELLAHQIAVSPAATHPRQLGQALQQDLSENPDRAMRAVSKLKPLVGDLPLPAGHEGLLKHLKNYVPG